MNSSQNYRPTLNLLNTAFCYFTFSVITTKITNIQYAHVYSSDRINYDTGVKLHKNLTSRLVFQVTGNFLTQKRTKIDLKVKSKIRCHQTRVTSRIHHNTYSY